MKIAVELLNESKRIALKELERIKQLTDDYHAELSQLNTRKVEAESMLIEIDKAISKLKGSE